MIEQNRDDDAVSSSMEALIYSSVALHKMDETQPVALAPLVAKTAARRAVAYDDAETRIVASEIDEEFYRANYPDIGRTGLDPVIHFHQHGWREHRLPNDWFETDFYMSTNPDIATANIDPLQHYITHGRDEARPPHRPGRVLRDIIDAAVAPADRRDGYDAPPGAPILTAAELGIVLSRAVMHARGFVIAASHDRYVDVTGGVQIFIADEQEVFNGDRFAYLHVSPAVARMTLAPEADVSIRLQLVLNGNFLGLADDNQLLEAIANLPPTLAPLRLFVVHSLFGHRVSVLASIADALRSSRNLFWLHDFATICEGYNLLRNNVRFCDGPPATSLSCRVCVYGAARVAYRRALLQLFDRTGFEVIAPSHAALAQWRRAGSIAHRSAIVHANALVQASWSTPISHTWSPDTPVRIAFVGFPMHSKGWNLFCDLVRVLRVMPIYRFFHFSTRETVRPMDGLTCIPIRVDRLDRFAMVDTLRNHKIDLVLALSPWPETFSYVTHEAFAAGADVITTTASGNVAAAVRRNTRGAVLQDGKALLAFFRDLHALAYMRDRVKKPTTALLAVGTSATLDRADWEATESSLPIGLFTTDPDLCVVAGGIVLPLVRDGLDYRIQLPPGNCAVVLISRSVIPGALTNRSTDRRRLGLAVARLRLDGTIVRLDDARLTAGWHLPEESWIWTCGYAVLTTGGAELLEITTDRLVRYLASPLAKGAV